LKYQAGRLLFGDIPIAALGYVRDTRAPAGLFADNAYTDFAKMVVVRSGPQSLGAWVTRSPGKMPNTSFPRARSGMLDMVRLAAATVGKIP
jgi:hypothetical protein